MCFERGNVGTLERSNVQTFKRSVALAVKRFFDLALCLGVLLMAWPALAAIAVLVKATSPGPVFFPQERVGRGQRAYRMLKFRTMTDRPSAPSALAWTTDDEARITHLGRFLRDYGLDELPQLWNILKGEMSIVGPRPPLPAQVEGYTERQKRMFDMRPGVLSLAAVEGRRSLPVVRRIDLHVRYVETWSLRLDVEILWRALFVVLRRQDTVEVAVKREADS